MAFYNLKNQYKKECALDYLERLIKKGAMIELKEVGKRGPDINRLYWVWLTCIEKETGLDKHEAHFLYRALFLPKEEEKICQLLKPEMYYQLRDHVSEFQYIEGMNLVIDIISRSTTDLSDAEFSDYLKKIRKHARVNMNVILLTLKDQGFEDYYREYGFI